MNAWWRLLRAAMEPCPRWERDRRSPLCQSTRVGPVRQDPSPLTTIFPRMLHSHQWEGLVVRMFWYKRDPQRSNTKQYFLRRFYLHYELIEKNFLWRSSLMDKLSAVRLTVDVLRTLLPRVEGQVGRQHDMYNPCSKEESSYECPTNNSQEIK